MIRFLSILALCIWASFLFASSVSGQPSIDTFEFVGRKDNVGFYVEAKMATGKRDAVRFVALMSVIKTEPNGLDPERYVFTNFLVNCTTKTSAMLRHKGQWGDQVIDQKIEKPETHKIEEGTLIDLAAGKVCKRFEK